MGFLTVTSLVSQKLSHPCLREVYGPLEQSLLISSQGLTYKVVVDACRSISYSVLGTRTLWFVASCFPFDFCCFKYLECGPINMISLVIACPENTGSSQK